mmetsp:Transcript_16636/g.34137  ORF Transcript_16636/g.34137 Transcript_16636/m.34137 type:complete len:82 (+) Transcript_16636:47-292(+)
MFQLLLTFQKLSKGEHEWTEVGGGVDSGKMTGSGEFITVDSTPSQEASIIAKPDSFEANLFGSIHQKSTAKWELNLTGRRM